jgi:hypothetical protein
VRAERIRGELLKLGIKVSKRTIQKYMRGVRGRRGGGRSWATFVKNHAERMWACGAERRSTMYCSSTISISRLFCANMHATSMKVGRIKDSANAYQRIP